MLIPVFTTWNVKIFEKCPKCSQPLTIKYSDNGMPFIACDNCTYKKELILFKKCPKCGSQMKYVHKHNKFKCNGCNSWFEVKLVENDNKENSSDDFIETLRKRIREIVQEEIKRMIIEDSDFRRTIQSIVTNNVIDNIINALKTYKTI